MALNAQGCSKSASGEWRVLNHKVDTNEFSFHDEFRKGT